MKIAVVGAGILGRLMALALVKAGHDLTLFDKEPVDNPNNCSMAAAGMLTAAIELEKSTVELYRLGKESLTKLWPAIIEQLSKPVYFEKRGALLLSHPQDKAELNRFIQVLKPKLADESLIQPLTKTELNELEPELEKFNEAYFFSEEGQVDNQSLMNVLAEELLARSVQWRVALVKETRPYQVVLNNSIEAFDWVIDVRGMGAKTVFNELRGIRGELIWLKAPDVKLKRLVRLLHPRYSLYVVPRPDQVYIVGATEIEAEDYSPISVRSSLELLSAAYYLHSGFAEARIIKTATQCRPTLSDHLPKIKIKDGWMAVNGLYRHGFLIAPALVEEVLRYFEVGMAGISYPNVWEEHHEVY